MSIKYTPRSAAATKVEGYAFSIPGSGVVASYAIPALDAFSQDVLGGTSPLIKSEVNQTQTGAPTDLDTFLEVSDALETKLTASQATGVSGLDATSDFVIVSPVAASLSGSYVQSEVETALDAKADQVAVTGLMALVEERVDGCEGKINALIAALKSSGVLAQ